MLTSSLYKACLTDKGCGPYISFCGLDYLVYVVVKCSALTPYSWRFDRRLIDVAPLCHERTCQIIIR
ncbi:unnamed protein product [Citrullus colocynthis]|uniref:Uncharacterized protein n=1 Tax=Citrullus colocynthis TaxID=252529 RepID=A0ABP0YXF0_9ROSI